ncbi:MAG: FAD/NAD(P)-binding protein [Armatimonadetes bacterium]|nr:FAD/NAD(P)-binding protein [Armatimonadota bacterium]
MCDNPYIPDLAVIESIVQETPDTRTFRAVFADEYIRKQFAYEPGQFQQVSVFGVGEATFCLTSTPTRSGFIEFSVKRVGSVTGALHEMPEGAMVGIRAPMGNHFPYEQFKGKDLWFIGGGIGMAPLRSLLNFCLDGRADYGRINILYGARSPEDLCYSAEFSVWQASPDTRLFLTVDKDDPSWTGNVGFVPACLTDLAPSPQNAVAITCGPPIMIKYVLQNLLKLGFADEQIYTTLEMKMKCGIGKCGRCNIGPLYVCADGPIFSCAQLKELPPEH